MKLAMPTLNYKDKAIEISTYEATALKVYDVFGVIEVFLSCDKSNEASSKVIKKCGGVLQDEFYSDIFKSEIQMYLISKEK